jgi:hypothetical protein
VKAQGNEVHESARLVLLVTHAEDVVDAVLVLLKMAVEHGATGLKSHFVR